jgi:photosystem II stability/assembly factor-like uncharacterized protein
LILSILFATATSATAASAYKTWYQTSTGMEDTNLHYPDASGFVFSPDYISDHTIYAGTYNGIYKSTDSGFTWALSSTNLGNEHVNSLAISPNYASDHTLATATGDGVYLSTNYGASWTDISGSLPDRTDEVVVFHPNYSYPSFPDLFVGTSGSGVYRTTATSWNWQAMNSGMCEQRVLALAFTPDYAASSNGTLFAGVDGSGGGDCGGVYKVQKGSTTWTGLNTGLPTSVSSRVVDALAISPAYTSDHTVFAGISAGQGIYRTTSGGTSWTFLEGTDTFYIQSLVISPYYPCDGTLFAGEASDGVYRSHDKGATWADINTGFDTDKSVLALAIAPAKAGPVLYIFSGIFSDAVWQYSDPHACLYVPFVKK